MHAILRFFVELVPRLTWTVRKSQSALERFLTVATPILVPAGFSGPERVLRKGHISYPVASFSRGTITIQLTHLGYDGFGTIKYKSDKGYATHDQIMKFLGLSNVYVLRAGSNHLPMERRESQQLLALHKDLEVLVERLAVVGDNPVAAEIHHIQQELLKQIGLNP